MGKHKDFDKMVAWLGAGEMDVGMMLRVGIVSQEEVIAICRTLEDSPWFHRPRNMRFWVWWNHGWVKLTLTRKRPVIKLSRGDWTEEGWSAEHEVFKLAPEGKGVDCEKHTYAKDCDGPHEWHWEGFCHYTELREPIEDEIFDGDSPGERPKWQEKSCSQRDMYAEVAGY